MADGAIGGAPKKKEESASVDYLHPLKTERLRQTDRQKSWPTSAPLYTPVTSRGTQRQQPLSPTSPCRSRRSTPSMMAGTWPASSSFCSSSSPSSLWLPWPYSMSYWTVAAVPKERHITSSRRRGREAAAS